MNVNTGELISKEELETLPRDDRRNYVEVKRDVTAKEKCEKQILLYGPCSCGSGKKFKFCCFKKS